MLFKSPAEAAGEAKPFTAGEQARLRRLMPINGDRLHSRHAGENQPWQATADKPGAGKKAFATRITLNDMPFPQSVSMLSARNSTKGGVAQ